MKILKIAVFLFSASVALVAKVHAQENSAGHNSASQAHEVSYEETHARVSRMLEIALSETDFAAVRDHLIKTLRPHSEAFGVSPEMLENEVGMGVDHIISVIGQSPERVAEEIAHILLDIQMHKPVDQ